MSPPTTTMEIDSAHVVTEQPSQQPHQPLPTLPYDLYSRIAKEIKSSKDLLEFSLTCKGVYESVWSPYDYYDRFGMVKPVNLHDTWKTVGRMGKIVPLSMTFCKEHEERRYQVMQAVQLKPANVASPWSPECSYAFVFVNVLESDQEQHPVLQVPLTGLQFGNHILDLEYRLGTTEKWAAFRCNTCTCSHLFDIRSGRLLANLELVGRQEEMDAANVIEPEEEEQTIEFGGAEKHVVRAHKRSSYAEYPDLTVSDDGKLVLAYLQKNPDGFITWDTGNLLETTKSSNQAVTIQGKQLPMPEPDLVYNGCGIGVKNDVTFMIMVFEIPSFSSPESSPILAGMYVYNFRILDIETGEQIIMFNLTSHEPYDPLNAVFHRAQVLYVDKSRLVVSFRNELDYRVDSVAIQCWDFADRNRPILQVQLRFSGKGDLVNRHFHVWTSAGLSQVRPLPYYSIPGMPSRFGSFCLHDIQHILNQFAEWYETGQESETSLRDFFSSLGYLVSGGVLLAHEATDGMLYDGKARNCVLVSHDRRSAIVYNDRNPTDPIWWINYIEVNEKLKLEEIFSHPGDPSSPGTTGDLLDS
eukprot:CAMPEP_0184706710 /NCGR_PEP_ID=MMETSP0313-20130426/36899_1 /TAXON_ID=2792 /ORGANISM="Porphyridium aerugineum, Strain SAG 1380-2" /LENGTH=581 /DNA_ID=CAMNT_0027168271 /DNA_START=114 /DNA_END=1859 /DNA_ORIENTATION=-